MRKTIFAALVAAAILGQPKPALSEGASNQSGHPGWFFHGQSVGMSMDAFMGSNRNMPYWRHDWRGDQLRGGGLAFMTDLGGERMGQAYIKFDTGRAYYPGDGEGRSALRFGFDLDVTASTSLNLDFSVPTGDETRAVSQGNGAGLGLTFRF
jgi:hypothetical protein